MKTKSKVYFSYYFVVVSLMLVSIIINATADNMSSNQVDVTFTLLSQVVCMLMLPIALYFLIVKPKSSASMFCQDFGVKHFKNGELPKVILLGLIAIFLNTVFAQVNYSLLSLTGYTYGTSVSKDYVSNIGWLFGDILLTACLPALCEETAHRGFFRVAYKNDPVKYILLSSLFFALMHQNIAQVLYTFLTGLMFASVVLFTGNLKASMIIHFMVNCTEVLGDFGRQTGNVFLMGKDLLFGILLSNIVLKILLVFITLLLVYLFARILYSFKSKQKFSVQKFERMFVDGSLQQDFSEEILVDTASTKDKVICKSMLSAVLFIGIMCNIVTLVWGLLR